MSRFRYVILPRLLLVLSSLALLAALFLLWLSLERPLPSQALALAQASSANCFTGGELLASGPVRMEQASPDADVWAVLRSGDTYARAELQRTAGLLWRVSGFYLIDPAATGSPTLFPTCGAYSLYDSSVDGNPFAFPRRSSELIPLAICMEPSVVRLEGEALILANWEDTREALADRGVPISWTPAGNGVWVGDSVTTSWPIDPEDESRSGGTLSIWLRGYDAAGNLVCSYDPTV